MFGVGLFVGLTFGIIIGLCIHAWVESPRKIKVGTPSASHNSRVMPLCSISGGQCIKRWCIMYQPESVCTKLTA